MATTLFQGAQLQADAYTSPITGIKVTIDCVDNGTQPTWTSLGLDSGLWGQIGYLGGNQGHYLTPFFQVWDLSGGGLLFDGTKDHSKLSIGTHTFEMSEWKGNVWQFSIDGKKIGTYDMHDNDADAPGFSVAGFTGTEFSSDIPSTIDFHNFSIRQDGAWHVVTDAIWHTQGTVQPPDTYTGAQGHLQDPTIPDGDWSQGSDLPVISSGTHLWDLTV